MFDLKLSANTLTDRLKCSLEDKLECVDILNYILYLANVAQYEGLLALEQETNKMDNRFLADCIELIVDGTDPQIVEKYATVYIAANNYKGKEFLKNIIIAEGSLLIQQGCSSIIDRLIPYFGRESELILDKLNLNFESDSPKNTQRDFEKYRDTEILSKNTSLLEKYLSLSFREIDMILQELEPEILGHALKGASGKIKLKFLSYMIEDKLNRVQQAIEDNIDEFTIVDAQKNICKTIEKLSLLGKIYIPNENYKREFVSSVNCTIVDENNPESVNNFEVIVRKDKLNEFITVINSDENSGFTMSVPIKYLNSDI